MKINIANPTTGMQKQLVLIWSCHFCEAENCFANHAWFALKKPVRPPGNKAAPSKEDRDWWRQEAVPSFRQAYGTGGSCGLEYVVQMYCQYRDSVLKEGLFYHAYKRIPYEPIETFLTADVACKGVGWFPRRWVQGIGEFVTQVIFLFRSLSRFISILRSGANHQLSLWIFNGSFLIWATSESLPGLRLPHWWRQRQAGAALWDLSLVSTWV